jgi:hypothetical protein
MVPSDWMHIPSYSINMVMFCSYCILLGFGIYMSMYVVADFICDLTVILLFFNSQYHIYL